MQSYRQYRQIVACVKDQCHNKQQHILEHDQAKLTLDAEANEKLAGAGSVKDGARREASRASQQTTIDEGTRPATSSTRQSWACCRPELAYYLSGIEVQRKPVQEGYQDQDQKIFSVNFSGDNDQLDPRNWSYAKRMGSLANIAAVCWIVGFASSADSGALPQAARYFSTSDTVESLATALFLIAFGCGSLIFGPLSEEFGRNPVYITTMIMFMIFTMAAALAPNIAAQLVFRYIAGTFAATPLTCAGGSVSDLFGPVERGYAFPVIALMAFTGPLCGPIVGALIGESNLPWQWIEWVTLMGAAIVLALLVFTQPETYAPVLLRWKAQNLRALTGDDRYVSSYETQRTTTATTLSQRIRQALYRPFVILFKEPIVICWGIYITVIYVVLFTFLNGYTFIFTDTYGISQGLTGLVFVGIIVGILLALVLVPVVTSWYRHELRVAQDTDGPEATLPPESRLRYGMIGSWALPISLFWMGWTAQPDISIWSAISASVVFGFGVLTVFMSCYQYIIDVYDVYAASALASITVMRYVVAGGMVTVAIPMYEKLEVRWTLTLLGCLSAIMAPIPFVLYRYGWKIRARSSFAMSMAKCMEDLTAQ